MKEKAIEELIHIKEYISKDSLYYAEKTVKEIKEKIGNLLLFPYMGRYVPELDSKEIREIIYKSYRILYNLNSDNIYILRIIHHSRNFSDFKSNLY